MTTGDAWVDAFAAKMGVDPPTAQERKDILAIAAIAAHDSERFAAPIVCWISGATGKSLADALRLADELRDS